MQRTAVGVVLMGVALAGVPLGSAEAQWVLLGRRVLGRVEQMRQAPDSGQPGADVASVIVDAPASSRVVEAVLRVCREMRKQCSVGG